MVGDGEMRGEAERAVAAIGMSDRFSFLGWRPEVPDLMAAFDVFLLTSRWEGLPKVVPQALIAGCPVVATAVDGTREIVDHGVDGVLAPPGDVDLLARGVTDILSGTASAGCGEEAGTPGPGVRPGRDGAGAGAALRGDPRGKGVSRLVMMAVAAFLVGACIGSFLNVVIHRLPRGESIVSPRSRCPGCGRAIRAWENIPIASFIVLGGKCAGCGGAISWRYPAVELLTATGFAAIFLLDAPGIPLLRDLLFFSLLVPIAFIDIDHRIIPDELSLGGLVAGLLLSLLPGGEWKRSVAGALLGGGILYATAFLYEKVRGAEGMGGGDIKLLAMIGAFVGWRGTLATIFFGALLGATGGILAMRKGGEGLKTAIPFGPYLCVAALLSRYLDEWILGDDPSLNDEVLPRYEQGKALGSGRRAVPLHPHCENQQRPQPVLVVPAPRQVLPDDPPNPLRSKISLPAHAVFVQILQQQRSKLIAQPTVDRDAESHLRAVDQLPRHMSVEDLPEQMLRSSSVHFVLHRQAGGELHDPVVEQRHPRFQRVRHRRAVYFRQDVVHQVRLDVGGHRAFDDPSTTGIPERPEEWKLGVVEHLRDDLTETLSLEDPHGVEVHLRRVVVQDALRPPLCLVDRDTGEEGGNRFSKEARDPKRQVPLPDPAVPRVPAEQLVPSVP